MKSNKSGMFLIAGVLIFAFGGMYLAGQNNAAPAAGSTGGSAAVGSYSELLNKPAPNFSLQDKEGNVYTLASLKGKKVVLFFNEGIMCYPACWNQVLALGTDPRLNTADTVSLSIVVDSKEQWDSAIAKMPELSKAKTVFDFSRAASSAYGVLTTPSSMHYGSLPGHTYVVLDKEGIVRYVLDDPRMAINNDVIYSEIQQIK